MSSLKFHAVVTTPATIRVADIVPNPINPRRVAEGERSELADSLLAVGQLARIWVRPHGSGPGKYELVDGERRWWGAQAAGLEVLDALVGDWTDEQVVVIAFTTGTQAKKLDPIAEARGLKWLKDRTGASLRDIAERLGISHSSVNRGVTVIEGFEFIIAEVVAGSLPMRTAFELASIEDAAMAKAALAEVMAPVADGFPPLSKDATHKLIKKRYAKPRPAPVLSEGQIGLTNEQSMDVFPVGSIDPDPASGYVAYTRPIPADLLKPEVAAGAAIKFSDVAIGAKVYVGVDEAGKSVAMVKLAEALAAVQPEDRHIFREQVAASYSIPKAARPAGEPPSRRAEEAAESRERKAAERAQKKKDRAVVAWLRELRAAVAMGDAVEHLPFWSLLFEGELARLSVDDLALLAMVEDITLGGGESVAEDIEHHAGELPLAELIALVVEMWMLPTLRAQGVNAPLVKEWQASIIAVSSSGGQAAGLPAGECGKLTELVRAHASGMSAPKLAREFAMTLRDVCGALELDYEAEAGEWSGLGEALEVAFVGGGVKPEARPAMIKLQLGRDVPMAELVPEEIKRLLEMLCRVDVCKAAVKKSA